MHVVERPKNFCHEMREQKASIVVKGLQKEAERKQLAKQKEDFLKISQPVFKMFEAGYKPLLGEDETSKIVSRYRRFPIAMQSLITRLGDELEIRGISPMTWQTIATKRFL